MSSKLVLKTCVSIDLFSRLVSKQVSSAQQSLTSVFGMGTGGPSAVISLIKQISLLVHRKVKFAKQTHPVNRLRFT